jgi:N-acetylglutamate synthase-like GNAT family acetyltransferase
VASVRHATPADLERISGLLAELRRVDGLVERKPGIFYRKSRAFLHFHEDPTGMFADVRLVGDDFQRLGVTSRAEQAALLSQVRRAVGEERLA